MSASDQRRRLVAAYIINVLTTGTEGFQPSPKGTLKKTLILAKQERLVTPCYAARLAFAEIAVSQPVTNPPDSPPAGDLMQANDDGRVPLYRARLHTTDRTHQRQY
jgi:hypothetical protein